MGTICGRFGMNWEVRDIFEIQAEIARRIAERLKVTLRGWGGDHWLRSREPPLTQFPESG